MISNVEFIVFSDKVFNEHFRISFCIERCWVPNLKPWRSNRVTCIRIVSCWRRVFIFPERSYPHAFQHVINFWFFVNSIGIPERIDSPAECRVDFTSTRMVFEEICYIIDTVSICDPYFIILSPMASNVIAGILWKVSLMISRLKLFT